MTDIKYVNPFLCVANSIVTRKKPHALNKNISVSNLSKRSTSVYDKLLLNMLSKLHDTGSLPKLQPSIYPKLNQFRPSKKPTFNCTNKFISTPFTSLPPPK